MAIVNPVGYLHNLTTHTAQVDRLSSGSGLILPSAVGELRAKGGVRLMGEYNVTAQGTPNMTVNVAAGMAYVPGPTAIAGTYAVPNDGVIVVTIGAAHASLVRRDLICIRVRDSFYTGASNDGAVVVIAGTAGSGTDPALPTDGSYLILARITVPAAATSINAVAITFLARPAMTVGSIIPVLAGDVTPGIYDGQYRDMQGVGLQRWTAGTTSWDNVKDADTGWVACTIQSGFAVNGAETPAVRLIGKEVKMRGAWGATGFTTSMSNAAIGTVPVGYRPPFTVRCNGPGLGGVGQFARLFITTAGTIAVDTTATASQTPSLLSVTGLLNWMID